MPAPITVSATGSVVLPSEGVMHDLLRRGLVRTANTPLVRARLCGSAP